MKKNDQSIIVLESSDILYEGLYTLLSRWDKNSRIARAHSIDELLQPCHQNYPHLICINTLLALNKEKEIKRLKKEYPQTILCAIISNAMDTRILVEFDASFNLYDYTEEIFSTINKAYKEKTVARETDTTNEALSEREIEVLLQVIHGLTNKEIAEKLNISVHTVISHRKNLTLKTGIRSESGLTIYAISKGLVNLDLFTH